MNALFGSFQVPRDAIQVVPMLATETLDGRLWIVDEVGIRIRGDEM